MGEVITPRRKETENKMKEEGRVTYVDGRSIDAEIGKGIEKVNEEMYQELKEKGIKIQRSIG